MMTFSFKGIRIRMHASLLVMMSLAALVAGAGHVLITVASILAHEAGHALASRLCGAKLTEIEFMPLGAAARIEDMYGLSVKKAVAVALAGPAVSGALCAICGALPQETAYMARGVNASLALFNLLPALPLDGGRVVCRLISCRLSQRSATGACIAAGKVLAVVMLMATAAGYLSNGRLNLTFAMSAVYILMSGGRERLASGGGILLSMLDRKKYISDAGSIPVKWLAAVEDTRLEALLGGFRPGCVHRVAVYDQGMRLKGVVEEDMILKATIGNKPLTVGEMIV